ncbi:unnamed protein product [Effrenium voratum]|uniref:Uncharacterized protein n=1 Tax=Effrenium voratum TaxID=2562239 RepID=A0AA36IEJ8_9DINO|nr:unnamed protein product [Effrenium voratum]
MAVLSAAYGASALFGFNRENFEFDKKQTLRRETFRLEMQLKRFALFRDDVRDLVKLTVDRMDVYHLLGALFMKFCIIVFCKGRIQASAPPFILQLFQLSNACAFMYLLLAVWLSMHASIASHSFGVKMLTRFVRLPIPTQNQITSLQAKLIDFEKQGVAQMLRMPFQDHQEWEQVRGEKMKAAAAASGPPETPEAKGPKIPKLVGGSKTMGQVSGLRAAAAVGATSSLLLDSQETQPFEDLLTSSRGAMPERHVQLFRKLQFKWQCYDAYCRVCLGLGLNHILQALTYYCICHTLVENQMPTLGFALVVLFQTATIFVAFLDLAGLQHREIIAVQVASIAPGVVAALEVSLSSRDSEGKLLTQDFWFSPVSFLCHAVWLELWLRIAWPSGAEEKLAQLPRRFRQVLFLDPFGDCFWDPNQMGFSWFEALDSEKDTEQAAALQAAHDAAGTTTSQLAMAQCALRRWQSVPSWCCSAQQRSELARLEERRTKCGGAIRTELERCGRPGLESMMDIFERTLRRWQRLTPEEQASDPFANCLLGPFEQDTGGGKTSCFYYDLENERTVFSETTQGLLVLSLPALVELMKDCEMQAENLVELRILRDLTVARKNQEVRARVRAARPRSLRQRVQTRLKEDSTRFGTNLVGLFNQKRPAKHGHSWAPLPEGDADEPQFARASSVDSQDLTLRAVAGKHAADFVPERLPWQILCRLTRMCQLTWFMCGLMTLLKELGMYQVDFQLHAARQLTESLRLQELPVHWPNGSFFVADGLSCSSGLVISSPTGLFLGSEEGRLELLAPRAVPGLAMLGEDLLAPARGGLQFWSLRDLQQGLAGEYLPLDGGADWKMVAGGLVECQEVPPLVGTSREGRCLLLAGWDGEMLPVAVLPGCAGCGARQLLRAAKEVRPSLAAPLPPAESAQGVQAIHIEGTQLWALLSGHLQAWDLASPRSGRWVLHWPAEALPVVGICFTSCSEMEGPDVQPLLLLSRQGPSLLRASVPRI